MKRYIAELIGSFAWVFFGTGAIIINEDVPGSITHVGVAIVFGLVVATMIYAFGEKSGAHFNPAVTIAFTVNRNLPVSDMNRYIICQLAGGLLASVLLKLLFPDSALLGATVPAGSNLQSFTMEFILSFFLMLVILQVSKGSKEQGLYAGIAIGGLVLLETMFAAPVSGASMNPVRSLAPAIISGELSTVWIYICAPIMGMLAAVPVYRRIR